MVVAARNLPASQRKCNRDSPHQYCRRDHSSGAADGCRTIKIQLQQSPSPLRKGLVLNSDKASRPVLFKKVNDGSRIFSIMCTISCVLLIWRLRWVLTPQSEFDFIEPQLTIMKTSERIPRIVHQSYKTKNLPPLWKETPSRWKKSNSDVKYMFWTDEDNRNLIATDYPWFLKTYDSYRYPIQRADAARYFAVLKYGGIYTDLDIMPRRDITPLLDWLSSEEHKDKEMIIAQTYNLGLTNALFAAVPSSKVLDDYVHDLPNHQHPFFGFEFLLPHFGVLLSTGPTRFWIYFAGLSEKIVTLPPSGWGQCHQCRQNRATAGGQPGQCKVQPTSFFETTTGGSWHKWDTRFMNFIFCSPQFFIWLVFGALVTIERYIAGVRRFSNANNISGEDLPLVQEADDDKKGGRNNRRLQYAYWKVLLKDEANIWMVVRRLVKRRELLVYFAVLMALRIL